VMQQEEALPFFFLRKRTERATRQARDPRKRFYRTKSRDFFPFLFLFF
jgi:hypothetical protein